MLSAFAEKPTDLPGEELLRAFESCPVRSYEDGEHIVRPDPPGDEVLVPRALVDVHDHHPSSLLAGDLDHFFDTSGLIRWKSHRGCRSRYWWRARIRLRGARSPQTEHLTRAHEQSNEKALDISEGIHPGIRFSGDEQKKVRSAGVHRAGIDHTDLRRTTDRTAVDLGRAGGRSAPILYREGRPRQRKRLSKRAMPVTDSGPRSRRTPRLIVRGSSFLSGLVRAVDILGRGEAAESTRTGSRRSRVRSESSR